jgi:WhiB family redox-sensing transcriptional regulator
MTTTETSDWRSLALCTDEDPELFFPIGSTGPGVAQARHAVRICRRCPVSEPCLTWALDNHQDAGVWGGLTEDDRRSLLRRRRAGATTRS